MFVVAATFLVIYFAYLWNYRHLLFHSRKLPGPISLPFIGNLVIFTNNGVKNFRSFFRLGQSYGSVFRLWFGPKLCVFLSDPEVIANVFGNDLSSVEDDLDKIDHKFTEPACKRRILQIFAKDASILEKYFFNRVYGNLSGRTFDIFKDIMNFTSIDTDVSKTQETEHESIMSRIGYQVGKQIVQPWILFDWVNRLTTYGREEVGCRKILHEASEGFTSYRQQDTGSAGVFIAPDKKINSFLDMMLSASESHGSLLSSDDLLDEVSTLLVGDSETTARTMSFLLLLIALHTDVQDQIHQELDDIFGDSRRLATADDLDKMVVLERAIKETLRLYPVTTFVPRMLTKDIPIGNGRVLPKDSVAVVFPFMLHRNKVHFEDPNSFCPDRWMSSSAKLHPYAYLPYGEEVKTNVGRHYAMLQMKCTLGTILRQLKVSTQLTFNDVTNNLVAGASLEFNPDVGFMVEMDHRMSAVHVW